ncbi:hypothetical protein [Levilactobacillus yonginensis]|uniref:hypothetical protein n=1 Tax=Levilactobacillus yonginensis TaxID=1054041 RepID=UPI00345D586B
MRKKIKVSLLLISIVILSVLTITPLTPAQAATWHKGTPKVLRGSWNTKQLYSKSRIPFKKGNPHHYRIRFYISNTWLDVLKDGGNSAGSTKKTTYRSLHHHVYQLKQYWVEGGTTITKFKVKTKKKAYVYAPYKHVITKVSNSTPF